MFSGGQPGTSMLPPDKVVLVAEFAWLLWRAPLIGLDEALSSRSTSNRWSAQTSRQENPRG
jgi:hypothetical protein